MEYIVQQQEYYFLKCILILKYNNAFIIFTLPFKISQIYSVLFFIKLNTVVILGLRFKQLLECHQELLRRERELKIRAM